MDSSSSGSNGPLVNRYPGNPILTGAAFPPEYRIMRVLNSGVIKVGPRYVMVCRVEDRALRNYISPTLDRDLP